MVKRNFSVREYCMCNWVNIESIQIEHEKQSHLCRYVSTNSIRQWWALFEIQGYFCQYTCTTGYVCELSSSWIP